MRLVIGNRLFREVAAKEIEDRVAGREIGSDLRLRREEGASEIADAGLDGEKDAATEQQVLERRGLGQGGDNVRRDAATAKNLAAALGQLNLGLARGLGVVVVVVEGAALVIALNEPPAGGVVLRGGQQQGGVFAERKLGLHQGLAETGFADDEAAVVILKSPGDNLRGGGALPVDEHNKRDVKLSLAARGVIAPVRGGAAAMADD